jgi:hypothetical protein
MKEVKDKHNSIRFLNDFSVHKNQRMETQDKEKVNKEEVSDKRRS